MVSASTSMPTQSAPELQRTDFCSLVRYSEAARTKSKAREGGYQRSQIRPITLKVFRDAEYSSLSVIVRCSLLQYSQRAAADISSPAHRVGSARHPSQVAPSQFPLPLFSPLLPHSSERLPGKQPTPLEACCDSTIAFQASINPANIIGALGRAERGA